MRSWSSVMPMAAMAITGLRLSASATLLSFPGRYSTTKLCWLICCCSLVRVFVCIADRAVIGLLSTSSLNFDPCRYTW